MKLLRTVPHKKRLKGCRSYICVNPEERVQFQAVSDWHLAIKFGPAVHENFGNSMCSRAGTCLYFFMLFFVLSMVNDWSPASLPASRDNKTGWHKVHQKFAKKAFTTSSEILLLGDSIIRGLTRYEKVWENYFPSAINLGIGGDKTQNVLWRMRNLRLSHNIKFVIVHCGTNNIDLNSADDIANALIQIAKKVYIYNPDVKVVLSSILPRDNNISIRRNKIIKTNNILKDACKVSNNVYYFQHDHDWLHKDGNLNANYYYVDNLHLSKDGNRKFAQEIKRMIQTIRNDVDIHPPYLPTPIHPYSTHAPPPLGSLTLLNALNGKCMSMLLHHHLLHHPVSYPLHHLVHLILYHLLNCHSGVHAHHLLGQCQLQSYQIMVFVVALFWVDVWVHAGVVVELMMLRNVMSRIHLLLCHHLCLQYQYHSFSFLSF